MSGMQSKAVRPKKRKKQRKPTEEDASWGVRVRWKSSVAIAKALVCLLNLLPYAFSCRLGSRIGALCFACLGRRRIKMLDHLAFVYPDWTRTQCIATARASFANLGRSFVEWALLQTLSPAEILQRTTYRGTENLQRIAARGKGVICVGAHSGNWEWMLVSVAAQLRELGLETLAVGRAVGNPELYRWIVDVRGKTGAQTYPQKMLPLVKGLRRGAVLGLLVDQYWREQRGGVLAPFLGHPAWTTTGPVALAMQTGAGVLPVSIRRLADGTQEVVYGEEVALEHLEIAEVAQADADGDALASEEERQARRDRRAFAEGMRRINAAVGEIIRQNPGAWLWFHHRWRKTPDFRAFRRSRRRALREPQV